MVELKILNLDEIPTYIKMVVYGIPGVGKTIFAANAPHALLVDSEDGILSLKNEKLQEKGIIPKNIKVFPLDSFRDINQVFDYLANEKHQFKTVILDGFSELLRKDVDNIMEQLLIKYPDKNPDVISQTEWGIDTQHMRKVIRLFRRLPMHVIYVCQTREDDTDEGLRIVRPGVTPSVLNILSAYVDIIAYMFRTGKPGDPPEKQSRAMLFQPTEKYWAKDRTGKLGAAMVNPTFPDILRLLGLDKKI